MKIPLLYFSKFLLHAFLRRYTPKQPKYFFVDLFSLILSLKKINSINHFIRLLFLNFCAVPMLFTCLYLCLIFFLFENSKLLFFILPIRKVLDVQPYCTAYYRRIISAVRNVCYFLILFFFMYRALGLYQTINVDVSFKSKQQAHSTHIKYLFQSHYIQFHRINKILAKARR